MALGSFLRHFMVIGLLGTWHRFPSGEKTKREKGKTGKSGTEEKKRNGRINSTLQALSVVKNLVYGRFFLRRTSA